MPATLGTLVVHPGENSNYSGRQGARTIWEATMAEPVANTQQRTQYAMPSAPSTVSLIRKITLELNSSQPSACVAMNTTPPLHTGKHAAFEVEKESTS